MARIPSRYHRIDGWRGYRIPGPAVCGASDTGSSYDSPCPSGEVKAEIRRVQREVLQPAGIASRTRFGGSSNVFCGKRWLCVSASDHARAIELVNTWLDANRFSTSYVHDARGNRS